VHYLMRLGISVTPVSGHQRDPGVGGTLTLDSCERQESGHCGRSELCQKETFAMQPAAFSLTPSVRSSGAAAAQVTT
jgi:hypothetical protein